MSRLRRGRQRTLCAQRPRTLLPSRHRRLCLLASAETSRHEAEKSPMLDLLYAIYCGSTQATCRACGGEGVGWLGRDEKGPGAGKRRRENEPSHLPSSKLCFPLVRSLYLVPHHRDRAASVVSRWRCSEMSPDVKLQIPQPKASRAHSLPDLWSQTALADRIGHADVSGAGNLWRC